MVDMIPKTINTAVAIYIIIYVSNVNQDTTSIPQDTVKEIINSVPTLTLNNKLVISVKMDFISISHNIYVSQRFLIAQYMDKNFYVKNVKEVLN